MMEQFEYQIKQDKTYAEQRNARLQDVIDDYLNWEDTNPRQMYDELLSSVDEIIAYHSLHLRRAETFRNMITPKPCPTCDPESVACRDHLGDE